MPRSEWNLSPTPPWLARGHRIVGAERFSEPFVVEKIHRDDWGKIIEADGRTCAAAGRSECALRATRGYRLTIQTDTGARERAIADYDAAGNPLVLSEAPIFRVRAGELRIAAGGLLYLVSVPRQQVPPPPNGNGSRRPRPPQPWHLVVASFVLFGGAGLAGFFWARS